MFDAEKFLKDFGIDHMTHGNKHCRPGWVQVHCRFCKGSNDYHLGVNVNEEYGNCYRCGWKSLTTIIKALAGCNYAEANKIISKYSRRNWSTSGVETKSKQFAAKPNELELPPGTEPLTDRHKNYLINRKFDPEKLERIYGIMGTGPIGNYKHRIIIPITYKRRLVSFQGRDITGKSDLKYKACDKEHEIIHHKNIVYGIDQSVGKGAVIVEGVFDKWRLGPGAVCTFGTGVTKEQIHFLAKHYDYFFTMFDPEEQAIKEARKVATALASLGKQVENILLDDCDPADLDQEDADYYMYELLGRKKV